MCRTGFYFFRTNQCSLWVLTGMGRLAVMGLISFVLLAGCAKNEKPEIQQSVERLYNKGLSYVHEGDYPSAVQSFEEVEKQHPYSKWATKAKLMVAYANYRNNNYDEAILALDRFIQLHPANSDVAYAMYLKGVSFYEQISDVTRDQKITELALNAFKDVISRFPESKYARDARGKIDLANDHLAAKEMEIGRYYHSKHQYLAAINRFRQVIENYQTTSHVPEALHRLTEAYLSLGIVEEAKKTAAVLGHNFPGSEWYIDTFEIVEGKRVRVDKEEDYPWWKLW